MTVKNFKVEPSFSSSAVQTGTRRAFFQNFRAARSYDSRIEFSRASTGSFFDANGVLRYAANDEPRFDHDPFTGESLGILHETASTNFFLNSAVSSNAIVIAGGGTQTGPDDTAANLAVAAATTVSYPSVGLSPVSFSSAVGEYTYISFSGYFGERVGSIELQPLIVLEVATSAGASPLYNLISINPANMTINFTTVAASCVEIVPAKIQLHPCGMHKVTWTIAYVQTATTRDRVRAYFQIRPTDGIIPYTGDGVSGFHFSSCQAELNFSQTSYIPTTTAAASRAADSSKISGANFASIFSTTETTAVVEFRTNWSGKTGALPVEPTIKNVFNFTNDTDSLFNGYGVRLIGNSSSSAVRFTARGEGSGTLVDLLYTNLAGVIEKGTQYKVVLGLRNNYLAGAVNGKGVMSSDNSTYGLQLPNSFGIGSGGVAGSYNRLDGHIQSIKVFNKCLTEDELQAQSELY